MYNINPITAHSFFPVSSVSVFSLYSKWCVSVRFPHQNASLLPHVCHMTSQLTPSLFEQRNYIWWGTQIVDLLILQSSLVPCSLVCLRFRFLQHPIVKHSQCMFFPQCKIWSFIPTYSGRQNFISVHFEVITSIVSFLWAYNTAARDVKGEWVHTAYDVSAACYHKRRTQRNFFCHTWYWRYHVNFFFNRYG